MKKAASLSVGLMTSYMLIGALASLTISSPFASAHPCDGGNPATWDQAFATCGDCKSGDHDHWYTPQGSTTSKKLCQSWADNGTCIAGDGGPSADVCSTTVGGHILDWTPASPAMASQAIMVALAAMGALLLVGLRQRN